MLIDYLPAGLAMLDDYDWNYRMLMVCRVYLNYFSKF
jgi:hypothetical protein